MVQTWALNPNSITLLVGEKKKKDVKKACQSQYIRSVCVQRWSPRVGTGAKASTCPGPAGLIAAWAPGDLSVLS